MEANGPWLIDLPPFVQSPAILFKEMIRESRVKLEDLSIQFIMKNVVKSSEGLFEYSAFALKTSVGGNVVKPQTLEEGSRFSNPGPVRQRERSGFRRGPEDWPSCHRPNARRPAAHPPEL